MGKRIHFIGVGGSGMSALAQILSWEGREVSGSDRFFDQGQNLSVRRILQEQGIRIFPQDGSGVKEASRAVASAAVESDVPDAKMAREIGVPLLFRWKLLEEMARGKKSLAVAGSNGKSTTAALLAWILVKNGFDPTFALGASLRKPERGLGNARRGNSEWFCFEADESDGGLENYRPFLGVITGVTPDHFSLPRLRELFSGFARECEKVLVINADCPVARELSAGGAARKLAFSIESDGDFRAGGLRLEKDRVGFRLNGVDFTLPLIGRHNVANALAAAAAAAELGLPLDRISASLTDFPGLERRLEIVSAPPGVTVIDDYAHNPAKVRAAILAARSLGPRVIAVYQPHGFAPLKLFLKELAAAFSEALRPQDSLFLLPVYYAGGTVQAEIESAGLAAAHSGPARVENLSREELLSRLPGLVRPGDVVLMMGARDPTLSEFASKIARSLDRGNT